jgi:hypothetical protein
MAERKVVPFDEFCYQLELIYSLLLHPVYAKKSLIQTSIFRVLASFLVLFPTVPRSVDTVL